MREERGPKVLLSAANVRMRALAKGLKGAVGPESQPAWLLEALPRAGAVGSRTIPAYNTSEKAQRGTLQRCRCRSQEYGVKR